MATKAELEARAAFIAKLAKKDSATFSALSEEAQKLLAAHETATTANDAAAAEKAAQDLLSLNASATQLAGQGATTFQKFWTGVGVGVLLLVVALLFTAVVIYLNELGAERLISIEGTRPLLTITAIVATVVFGGALLLGALFSSEAEFEVRFRHAREIFLVFSGIFGTVVGFYFGAGDDDERRVIVDATVERATVVAYATGGTSPYTISLSYGKDGKSKESIDTADGWAEFTLKPGADLAKPLLVEVADAKRQTGSKDVKLTDAQRKELEEAIGKDDKPKDVVTPPAQ